MARRQVIQAIEAGTSVLAPEQLLGYPLRIAYAPEKGIHLVSTRAIRRGERILRECPATFSLEDRHAQTYCGICCTLLTADDLRLWKPQAQGQDPTSLLCEGCSANNYLKDLNGALQRLNIKLRSASGDRGLYRMFFRLYLEYAGARLNQLDDDVVSLGMTFTHALAADPEFMDQDLVQDLERVALAIQQMLAASMPNGEEVPSLDEIQGVCANLVCNQHTVTSGTGCQNAQEIGRAVCPLAALFNHACEPNVHWRLCSETEGLMECTAVKDIREGSELTIAYLNPRQLQAMPVLQRRDYLYQQRRFWCRCDLCRGCCNRSGCGKQGCKTMCSRCRLVWYCCAECQRSDWSVHKLMCRRSESEE